jgi:hypothetical protein
MKKLKMNQYVAAGIVLAGLALAPDVRADVEIFLVGGNASQNIIYYQISNVLSGGITSVKISATNSVVRQYVGNVASGQPGAAYNPVTIDVSLLGAVQGLQDVGANNENLVTGVPQIPTVAVSSTSPQAVDVTTPLTSVGPTLVAPYAFVKKSSLSSDMAGITNLTSRQAVFLENNGGYISSFLLGGTNQNDTVYFVGRNLESAVRTEIDANIHHTSTISSWVTNSSGQPVQDPHTSDPGQNTGTSVKALLNVMTNTIGTLAAADIGTFTPLAYEGVPFSITNVENGTYPLWFYENYYYPSSGLSAPSSPQQTIITALIGAITNTGFQTTNTLFIGNYAPLSGMQWKRDYTDDGGKINPINY